MYAHGFVKVAACSPKTKTGDAHANVVEMLHCLESIKTKSVDFVLFPELCICGYSIGDLVFQKYLYRDNLNAIEVFLLNNTYSGIVILGTYLFVNDVAYNCALVIQGKTILGIVPKVYLPHAYEFYETRWFASGDMADIDFIELFGSTIPFGKLIFSNEDEQVKFGIEICEDYWSMASPHEALFANGAMMVFNCSASPEEIGKGDKRLLLARNASFKGTGAYIYTSNNCSESTSEVVFSNQKIICENGDVLDNYNHLNLESDWIVADIDIQKLHYIRRRKSWPKNLNGAFEPYSMVQYKLEPSFDFTFEKPFNLNPFMPVHDEDFERIIEMQAVSVKKRLDYIGIHQVVIGVSGGLDSTLALLSLCRMVDLYGMKREDILAVTLPSSNTSQKTYQNAITLMKALKVKMVDYPIEEDVLRQAKGIGLDVSKKDTTYENIQARFRTYTLMNLANMNGAIVIGTSDMSEVALGWSTFNGDQMAMYGINAGLPKTVVREVVRYHQKYYPEVKNEIQDIIDTPISPELTSAHQKTEQIIGKYEINDFILYHFWVNGDCEERLIWLLQVGFKLSDVEAKNYVDHFFKKFYSQQYKRLTMPESVKILEMSLSPRTETRLNGDIYKPTK
ncbi:MAG: NAD(+) synthase [Bacilli bacterium]|nr:NAD(+) synthase [Bacilli bacterium]